MFRELTPVLRLSCFLLCVLGLGISLSAPSVAQGADKGKDNIIKAFKKSRPLAREIFGEGEKTAAKIAKFNAEIAKIDVDDCPSDFRKVWNKWHANWKLHGKIKKAVEEGDTGQEGFLGLSELTLVLSFKQVVDVAAEYGVDADDY